jgi:GH24 family phage-related lysozyme (muramidase)
MHLLMPNALTTSTEGVAKIESHEAAIDGLYDDPAGFGTYGIGHLVHPADKYQSFLLLAANEYKLCESCLAKMWPGKKFETQYLKREVVAAGDYEKLYTKAQEQACCTIAPAKYKKPFSDLSATDQMRVKELGAEAVARETELLKKTIDEVFQQDLKPFESAVNQGVTGLDLIQEEFDALVSFTFNVGVGAFKGSTLLKRINENRYRNGEITTRPKAIADIEAAFLAWNKSGGKVLAGLTKRRQDEADRFLAKARQELTELKKAKQTKPQTNRKPND